MECAVLAKDNAFKPGADESVQSAEAQAYALHIVSTHRSRILPVEMARLGRAFAFFHPLEQVRLDSTVETRPYHWALVGLACTTRCWPCPSEGWWSWCGGGSRSSRLLAVGLDVVVSVALTFGQTRYRSTFEIALVLAAAVQLDWLWGRLRPRPGSGPADRMAPEVGSQGDAEGDPPSRRGAGHPGTPDPSLRRASPPRSPQGRIGGGRAGVQRFGGATR